MDLKRKNLMNDERIVCELNRVSENLKYVYHIMVAQIENPRLCPDCHNTIRLSHDETYEMALKSLNMLIGDMEILKTLKNEFAIRHVPDATNRLDSKNPPIGNCITNG